MDAMKQIEAAGKLVHLNLGGDGKGHEKQGVSDEQLVAAQGILNQIKGGGKEQTRPASCEQSAGRTGHCPENQVTGAGGRERSWIQGI